ncbi:MAG: hypothetical protein HY084_03425 [Gemmatimonadetes bacterium]|nr:hypothetical protein [Gemmatimonadota bacterium]
MHTTRLAFLGAVALAVAATAVACSDSPRAAGPVAPAAERADVVTPRTPDARANDDPATFRRIPAKYRWVGEEHNRLLNLAMQKAKAAHDDDPATYQRMKSDCGWVFVSMRDNMEPSAQRGGFASRRDEAIRAARQGIANLPQCRGSALPSLALFAAPLPSASSAALGEYEDISDATLAAISSMVGDIAEAGSPADIDAAIARAAGVAASLPGNQGDAVYSAASLAAGSAAYWSYALPSSNLLALFARTSDWQRFRGAVAADAGGCAGFLTAFGRWPLPWQVKIAGCLLTGAAASAMTLF